MCDLLQISRSGYYAWRTWPVSQREMANQQLLDKIKTAHEANRGCYGSPRIYHEIKDEIPCSVNRVARLMRQHGIRAKQSKRYKTTTQRNEDHPAAPKHLAQDFNASQPGEKWCGYHLRLDGRWLVVPGCGDWPLFPPYRGLGDECPDAYAIGQRGLPDGLAAVSAPGRPFVSLRPRQSIHQS